MKNISLIIPSKNEHECLTAVLTELQKYEFIDEILIVVDDQNDNSIPSAEKFKNCKILIQDKKGFGSAIIYGFKNAKNKFGCIFNADYSFDPKYLLTISELAKDNDFIFGSRYKNKFNSLDDTILTYLGNKVFTFMSKFFLKINLSDILFTYVLCDVKKFNLLNLKNLDFTLCISLPYQIAKNNFKYTEIEMHERKRLAGEKKVKEFKDGFLILIEILKCLFANLKK